MKHNSCLMCWVVASLVTATCFGQVKIGNNPGSVNPAAILELESTNSGLLLPRLTATQFSSIPNPPNGLIVFNTTENALFVRRDTGWNKIPATEQLFWSLNGNNIYNTNAGRVGIGTSTPTASLYVNGNDGFIARGTISQGATLTETGEASKLIWYPKKAAFRVGHLSNVGQFNWDEPNLGYNSIAGGEDAKATGDGSIGLGTEVNAAGLFSTSIGFSASSYGKFSTSIGLNTSAKAYGSIVLGNYNDVSDNPNANTPAQTDRLFQLGNGDQGVYKNAITVLRNGNTGIGVLSPAQKLEVNGQVKITGGSPGLGKVLTSDADGVASWQTAGSSGGSSWSLTGNSSLNAATNFLGTTDNTDVIFKQNNEEGLRIKQGGALLATGNPSTGVTPTSGAGARMMWIPAKSAFRAGSIDAAQWDNANVGLHSFAAGNKNTAGGDAAFVMGFNNNVSQSNGVAFGENNVLNLGPLSTGEASAAFGLSHVVGSFAGFAAGNSHTVNGQYATALGNTNTASGYSSVALGDHVNATGTTSVAIGNQSTASGNFSMALGRAVTASGINSYAFGYLANTNGKTGSFCIGDNSTDLVSPVMAFANNEMRMRFAGGYILYSDATNSNGVTLPPNGASWTFASDSNRKENIVPVDGEQFLEKIEKFKLSSWNYKNQNASKYRHYGPMAQDFYAAFGKDGIGTIGNDTTIASADFDGINFIAIQALEKRTIDLKEENAALKVRNEALASQFEKLTEEVTQQTVVLVKQIEDLKQLIMMQHEGKPMLVKKD